MLRQELDDLLCQRYQILFCDRHKTIYETAMCRGFCCGDGWFNIIDSLCSEIVAQVKAGKMPPVVVTQVKEKFGTLHFHFRGGNGETHRLKELARQKSERTCEECGRSVEIRAIEVGRVLCPICDTEQQDSK